MGVRINVRKFNVFLIVLIFETVRYKLEQSIKKGIFSNKNKSLRDKTYFDQYESIYS